MLYNLLLSVAMFVNLAIRFTLWRHPC